MDRLRSPDMDEIAPGGRAKEFVVGCAFGPGITVEMCMLKRNLGFGRRAGISGLQTPPETESEASRSEVGDGEVVEAPSNVAVNGPDGRQDEDHEFIREALDNLELD